MFITIFQDFLPPIFFTNLYLLFFINHLFTKKLFQDVFKEYLFLIKFPQFLSKLHLILYFNFLFHLNLSNIILFSYKYLI